MTKRGNKRKFGLEHVQRAALLRSLATALIDNGRIKTTKAKAKTLANYMDKLITTAKKQSVSARRQLREDLGEKAVKKLFSEVAPKFQSKAGGYTRVLNMGQRRSDGAPIALVEFIS